MKDLNSSFQKLTLVFTGILLAVVLPLYAVKVGLKTDYTDFDVYFRAAVRAKDSLWSEVYTLKDGASPFRYAPWFLPLLRPLASMNLLTAKIFWYLIQFLGFGFGFYWLFRTLHSVLRSTRFRHRFSHRQPPSALWVTALSLIYVLRFCVDTFTIGQISGLMFFGYGLALYGWTMRRPARGAFGILFPTLLKIGPGFLIGLFLTWNPRLRRAFLKALIGAVLGLTLLSSFWIIRDLSGVERLQHLWSQWGMIVAQDSVYYDASHYGSQSLNSVLLRGVKQGWVSPALASPFYLFSLFLICSSIFLFWSLRSPKTLYGRGLSFSMGIFVILWLMPETFKYSLTPLAIPFAFLFLKPKKSPGDAFALGFGFLVLSLAGKDFLPDEWFFGLQRYSAPFLTTVFLAVANFRTAWKETVPSRLALFLLQVFPYFWTYFWPDSRPDLHSKFNPKFNPKFKRKLGPWETHELSPDFSLRNLRVSFLVPLPLTSVSRASPETAIRTLDEIQSWLASTIGPAFEILLIPYGNRFSESHPLLKRLRVQSHPNWTRTQILVPQDAEKLQRGSALRAGFLLSKGEKIFFLQLENPCDLGFFKKAFRLLSPDLNSARVEKPYDLVRANRRLVETRFQIPVRVLPRVYQRHQLGLWFNQLIRWVLPIRTTDTHSGNLGMSWRLAAQAFALQTSENFLFDLELNLVSASQGYREMDLPVILSMTDEKNSSRVFYEALEILLGLPVLAMRYRQGCYRAIHAPQGITADDWGLSPGVNQGILELARLGIVRRISMMANTSFLEFGLNELKAIPGLELGLHFNLTYGKPLQSEETLALELMETSGLLTGCFISSPGRFLLRWCTPGSDRMRYQKHVDAELKAQLAKLTSLGVRPSYLDGHHHIHLVPGLLQSLAPTLKEYGQEGIEKIRLPYDPSLWWGTKAPLAFLSWANRPHFRKMQFRFQSCIYPPLSRFFDPGKLVAQLGKNHLSEVIVHPARSNDIPDLEFPDSYTQERVVEYRTLRMLEYVVKDLE